MTCVNDQQEYFLAKYQVLPPFLVMFKPHPITIIMEISDQKDELQAWIDWRTRHIVDVAE